MVFEMNEVRNWDFNEEDEEKCKQTPEIELTQRTNKGMVKIIYI